MTTTERVDRAALVRRAVIELVAERGFRGTSMAAVAERAGVATGTAYVHYASKDELVLAAHGEVKEELGAAAMAAIDLDAAPEERFRSMWVAIRDHLRHDPERAQFLIQVDASPHARTAHDAAVEANDSRLMEAVGPDLLALFTDLPALVLYDLSIGPIVRIVATGQELYEDDWNRLCTACWRAITEG